MNAAAGQSPPALLPEVLYRRLKAKWVYRTRTGTLAVADDAFRPRPEDIDGISLFRASRTTAAQAATADLTKPGKSGIGSMSTEAFLRLELTVVDSEPPPGHAVSPQVRPNASQDDQDRWAISLAAACTPTSWHQVPNGTMVPFPSFAQQV